MKLDFLNPVVEAVKSFVAPKAGKAAHAETSDRALSNVSYNLTPERLEGIINQANAGETRDLHRLATELEEKNWTIQQALQTRLAAVSGTPWNVEASDDSPGAKYIAEDFKKELESCGGGELDTFADLLGDMAYSVLPGISCSEIVWKPGGRLEGFSRVPNGNLVFPDFSGPQFAVAAGNTPMPPAKFVCMLRRSPSGDPARGGLIRTLAWLHCFMSVNFKDLLRFVERCGMPFLMAKVDQNTWQNERAVLKSLIRNFGPDGGGVFTRGVEMEFLQASTSNGEVYFKLLDYCDAAITKVILGQTASSGDGGGWSKDNAQENVRHDLLEADCIGVADVIKESVALPWTYFNYGPNAKPPKFKFLIDPPENLDEFAKLIDTLQNAGLEADPEEMSKRFGIKLTRRVYALPGDKQAFSAEKQALKEALPQPVASESEAAESLPPSSEGWVGKIVALAEEALNDESGEKIKALGNPENLELFETEKLSEIIENTVYAAYANGAASKADALSKHTKPKGGGNE